MWKFYELDVRGKLVAVKVESRKASNSRYVGNAKDPSNNRKASFKQGTPAGEGTNSTAKTPATAGSVWKSYKSGRK
jgi:hypothetical protein